jgi:uncharacterized OB-fold protein
MDNEYDPPYCLECGEEENLEYVETKANGEVWMCLECVNRYID